MVTNRFLSDAVMGLLSACVFVRHALSVAQLCVARMISQITLTVLTIVVRFVMLMVVLTVPESPNFSTTVVIV